MIKGIINLLIIKFKYFLFINYYFYYLFFFFFYTKRDSSISGSVSGDTIQQSYNNTAPRSARESLPSVDSAVDSWGELNEVNGFGSDIIKLWDTASIDSGQLDLPMSPYTGLVLNLIKYHFIYFK